MSRVLAYHKPAGLVVTHDDELGRETVYDRLVPKLPPALRRARWHAVGRLDKETTGLLLFTDDGAFVSFATQPSTAPPKTYEALVKGLLGEPELERLRAGVPLTGGLGTSAPCEARLLEHQKATSWITLTLREGKNREVRRMLLAIGSQVIRLARVAIGGLPLDLEEDRWRPVTPAELEGALGWRSAPAAARPGRRRA